MKFQCQATHAKNKIYYLNQSIISQDTDGLHNIQGGHDQSIGWLRYIKLDN